MKALTGRAAMKSPGHPSHRCDVERLFWQEIANGLTSEDAANAAGVSQAVGSRWLRQRGGMPLFMVAPLTGRYLSFSEREQIATLKAQGVGVREIARRLDRDPVDHLPGTAPQCGDPGREAGLPGIGRAVEGGAAGPASQAGEAGHE
jgi:hypothetical protein